MNEVSKKIVMMLTLFSDVDVYVNEYCNFKILINVIEIVVKILVLVYIPTVANLPFLPTSMDE